MTDSVIQNFVATAARSAGGWRVLIKIAPDRVQYIGGFESKAAAETWIEQKAQTWVRSLTDNL